VKSIFQNINYAKLLSNKYLLATLAFVVYLAFFHEYPWVDQWQERKERTALQEKKVYLKEEIKQIDKQTQAIKNDKAALEKYARENFLMKKKDEVLFIVEE